MVSTRSAPATAHPSLRRAGISLVRLVWVAPLVLIVALAVNLAIKLVVTQLNPSYARMAQLQAPLVILTIEGVVAAIVAFVIVALLVPRPVLWYRVLGVAALLVSLAPDVALAMGGAPMLATMRFVGALTSIAPGGPGGPPPAGAAPSPGGVAPGAFNFTTPIDQVLMLMLLHVATATVCIVLLTTLTRRGAWPRFAAGRRD